MTREQFERLKKFETNLFTATRFSYSRAMTNAQLEELADIYEEVTGTKVTFRNSCRQCDRLGLLKKTGKLFFDAKEEMEKEPEPVQVTEPAPKKRTRKSKKEE